MSTASAGIVRTTNSRSAEHVRFIGFTVRVAGKGPPNKPNDQPRRSTQSRWYFFQFPPSREAHTMCSKLHGAGVKGMSIQSESRIVAEGPRSVRLGGVCVWWSSVAKAAAFLAILSVLSGCFLFGGGPEDGASLLYVSQNGYDNNRGTEPHDPLRSLAVAVEAVAPGGTIKLQAGHYSREEMVHINKDVKIEGGYTDDFSSLAYDPANLQTENLSRLRGDNFYGRFMTIYGVAADQPSRIVTISGIEFGAAFTNENGAAMERGQRVDLTLDSCIFDWNQTNNGAGALQASGGGSLTVTNCTFHGNTSYWSPSVMLLSEMTAVFEACTFTDNTTLGHSAGNSAVIELHSGGNHTVSFKDCTFEDNYGTPLLLFETATKLDQGGNVGFAPPITAVTTAFTGWTTGIASATTVSEGPTTDGDETTTVYTNSDGSVTYTSVINTATAKGSYTYELSDYTYDAYCYTGTITATVTNAMTSPKVVYDGELTVSGGEINKIAYDYTFENSAFSGTITINDEFVYDLNDDLGL
jgi:hypothetical protein